MLERLFEKIQGKEEKAIDVERIAERAQTDMFQDKKAIHAFVELVNQLKEKLPTYETIISDDTSGRLVSLFFRKMVNKAREKAGEDHTQLYFIASGRHGSRQPEAQTAIGGFIDEKIKERGSLGKTLIVTEFTSTGDSVIALGEILEKKGVDFDLAVLSGGWEGYVPKRLRKKRSWKKYFGTKKGGELHFYDRDIFTGVEKKSDKPLTAYPQRSPEADRELMKKAREDVHMLAEELSVLLD